MNKKVVAVVVAYNPDSGILRLLESMHSQFDKIYVANNGLGSEISEEKIKNSNVNVEILEMGGNRGISYALNRGIDRAVEDKADYIAFFDQDSLVTSDYRSRMVNSFEKLQSDGVSVGILSPLFYDEKAQSHNGLLKVTKYWYDRKTEAFDRYEEVLSSITSGSLMPLWIFNKVGKFIDDMFIDYVDNEFCMRAHVAGYKTIVDTEIVIAHSLGDRKIVAVGKLRIKPTNHSALRKYYITRNRIYCVRRYGAKIPGMVPFEIIAFSMDTARIILFEKKRMSKLSNILKGIKDGIAFNPRHDYKF